MRLPSQRGPPDNSDKSAIVTQTVTQDEGWRGGVPRPRDLERKAVSEKIRTEKRRDGTGGLKPWVPQKSCSVMPVGTARTTLSFWMCHRDNNAESVAFTKRWRLVRLFQFDRRTAHTGKRPTSRCVQQKINNRSCHGEIRVGRQTSEE